MTTGGARDENSEEIPDLDSFVRTRLRQTVVMWPDQSIPHEMDL
jgi:hypothetical protein